MTTEKNYAAKWAKRQLEEGCIILDTETTGLDHFAEVVQVAAIDQDGNTLIDRLVEPVFRIPEEATAIHGIDNFMVLGMGAFNWQMASEELAKAVKGKRLIIYNAEYDLRVIEQSKQIAERISFGSCCTELEPSYVGCAMSYYAQYYGEWNDFKEDWKWQKLSNAAKQQGVAVKDAHTALGDCRMTLGVMQAMAMEVL